jgi:DNA-binding transcriptional LysR family regulator
MDGPMSWDQRIRRRLKLRDLDTLAAVARTGSMAKAAGQLAVSQPAVSKAVAEMERTLGVRLLDRTAQGVELTLYGRALLKWSTAVFDDLKQGINEIEFLSDPGAGHLHIGASEPMLGGFVPAVIDRLAQRYPRISIQVSPVSQWSAQLQALRERQIDLQLGRLNRPLEEDDLDSDTLFEEHAYVVADPKHPVAAKRKLKLADLVDEHWSLPPTESNVAGRIFSELFRAEGLDFPRHAIVTPSIQVHCGLLATGRYLAIFPGSLLQFGTRYMALKVLPVRLPGPAPVGITMLKNRTLIPVTRLFIETARDVAKSVRQPKKGRPSA